MTNIDATAATNVRESFTGQSLTESQIEESSAIAGILRGKIRKSGKFIKPLTKYSEAFASDNKFDVLRAETIIRDVFKALYGQTMNQMRVDLAEREAIIRETGEDQALHHARSIGTKISEGETMPRYRAFDEAAREMAQQHSITEVGAMDMMKDAFAKAEGRDLFNYCKELEQQFHVPKREAEYATRQKTRKQSQSRAPVQTM